MSDCPGSDILRSRRIPDFLGRKGDAAICKLPAMLPSMKPSDIGNVYGFTAGDLLKAWRPVFYAMNGGSSTVLDPESGCLGDPNVDRGVFTYVDWLQTTFDEAAGRRWVLTSEVRCTEDGDLTGDVTGDGGRIGSPALPALTLPAPLPMPMSAPVSVYGTSGGGEPPGPPEDGGQFWITAKDKALGKPLRIEWTSSPYYAGQAAFRNGYVALNVPVFETTLKNETTYFYLVYDATIDQPQIYIQETTSLLYSEFSGVVLIGSYTRENGVYKISQNIRQSDAVRIGPDYVGGCCILPGAPTTAAGRSNYIVSPNGATGRPPQPAQIHINGLKTDWSVNPATFTDVSTGRAIYAHFKPPEYSTETQSWSSPAIVTIDNNSGYESSTGSTIELNLRGYQGGYLNMWWTAAVTGTISDVLFTDAMG